MKKTNAIRILEASNTTFTLHSYRWDEEHLDAISCAKELAVDPHQVYKTIVCVDEHRNISVFCVPGPLSVSIKKAREVTGARKLTTVKLADLKSITGYQRGGCSPLGMKKAYPIYIDELCQLEQKIYISGGERGVQVGLSPTDLVRLCSATLADLT